MPDDLQIKTRLIIESAMAELKSIGMDHDTAAALLAVQALIRIDSQAKLEEVAAFIRSLQDTSGGHGERLQ